MRQTQFGIMEVKVIVSKMLRSFKWKSQRATNDIPVTGNIITRPSGGCHIDIENRRSADKLQTATVDFTRHIEENLDLLLKEYYRDL